MAPRKPIKKRTNQVSPTDSIVPTPQQIHKHLNKISRGFKALLNGVAPPTIPGIAVTDLIPKSKQIKVKE